MKWSLKDPIFWLIVVSIAALFLITYYRVLSVERNTVWTDLIFDGNKQIGLTPGHNVVWRERK